MDVEWKLGFDVIKLMYGKRLVAEVHNNTHWCVKDAEGEVLNVGIADTITQSQMEAAHKAIELGLLSFGGGRDDYDEDLPPHLREQVS